MKPRPETKVLVGDCRERLRELPEASVHCCVTSPPYFNQRDYGAEGQIGLERSPDCLGWATGSPCGECYVCTMVSVFREVRRVLRDDGTLWLNLGDKYNAYNANRGPSTGFSDGKEGRGHPVHDKGLTWPDLKPKDLCGIPWRVALALQADGWTLRSDVIWHKPNAMPGSQGDRPTINHEYLFLLAKRPSYYYDGEAIKERGGKSGTYFGSKKQQGTSRQDIGRPCSADWGSRTRRSVWTVPVASEKESHFAVFPERLILPCILAGTSERGACPACGAPWRRLVERGEYTKSDTSRKRGNAKGVAGHDHDQGEDINKTGGGYWPTKTVGWEPGCSCDAGEPVPATVLDPFGGSGTTAAAALKKGRSAILCELNPEYAAIIERKLKRARARAGFML